MHSIESIAIETNIRSFVSLVSLVPTLCSLPVRVTIATVLNTCKLQLSSLPSPDKRPNSRGHWCQDLCPGHWTCPIICALSTMVTIVLSFDNLHAFIHFGSQHSFQSNQLIQLYQCMTRLIADINNLFQMAIAMIVIIANVWTIVVSLFGALIDHRFDKALDVSDSQFL